jgi:hypothetical protein
MEGIILIYSFVRNCCNGEELRLQAAHRRNVEDGDAPRLEDLADQIHRWNDVKGAAVMHIVTRQRALQESDPNFDLRTDRYRT